MAYSLTSTTHGQPTMIINNINSGVANNLRKYKNLQSHLTTVALLKESKSEFAMCSKLRIS